MNKELSQFIARRNAAEDSEPMITRVQDELTLHEGASAHAEYVFWHGLPAVYEYDRTEDGPECEVITRILAAYPNEARTR